MKLNVLAVGSCQECPYLHGDCWCLHPGWPHESIEHYRFVGQQEGLTPIPKGCPLRRHNFTILFQEEGQA